MAKLSDLRETHRLFMEAYSYRSVDWRPGVPLHKPLNEARVAFITTAAFFAPGQPPFDTSIRGGDYSYRVLPADVDLPTLQIAHRSSAFDRALFVDYPMGYPLGRANQPELQRRIVSAMLELIRESVPPAVLRQFPSEA